MESKLPGSKSDIWLYNTTVETKVDIVSISVQVLESICKALRDSQVISCPTNILDIPCKKAFIDLIKLVAPLYLLVFIVNKELLDDTKDY